TEHNAKPDPSVDTQMTTPRAAGADTLLVANAGKPAAQAIKFATESGWKPLTFVTYAASSIITLKAAGLENAKGVITGQFVKPVGAPAFANDAGVKAYLADYEKCKPRFNQNDTLGQMGYTIADAVVKLLESMKEPTREAMLTAARNMKNVELALLYPGIKMNTGPGDQFPIEAMQLFQFN